ncbi:hypothetical protein XBJ2_310010 [Xenorhabdus bovienii str. Jollieti]|uniref:Uncharacterized protein n=1 Tax=Xenorhabdus bovienii (strain SS-2004) TaxID=406818 RepID=D3UWL3_XENBS|nr:hypothetical protein [Xenorhabdus bovienii]CBJ79848.1 hypothetical protein XBJ1_0707 [Xenorhabdus bovienii SS-2004]CDH29571.1 hypothetical protein XBJ2_310010 [Xenorhabdus bovienii str. Jollieti]
MTEYPEYVDYCLIEWYESEVILDFTIPIPDAKKEELDKVGCFIDSNEWTPTLSEKDVAYKLIFDEKMIFIWSALSNRANECRNPYMFYQSLTDEIISAIKGPSDWDLLTQKQKEEKTEKIKKLSFELNKEISNTPLDVSIMNYASHESYFQRFKRMHNSEKSNNMLDHHLEKYCFYKNSHFLPKYGHEGAIGWAWNSVGVTSPSISSFLQDLNEQANSFKCESILKRKNQIKRTFFVRKISAFFSDNFGTPLHNITATISSVFLDEDITIEEVRSMIR